MAEIDQTKRTIRIKIVYYGPPAGGKTTNLRRLHAGALDTRRGEMISINSLQDRTILFDLLPFTAVGPRGFVLRLQIVAVPGQGLYSATRRAALRGADGVVFVANSATDRWQENLTSYGEMKKHLIEQGIDPTVIPFAVQYNKRDLPLVTEVGVMDVGLKPRPEAAILAVANKGEGVIETFEAILGRTLRSLALKFRVLAMEDGRTAEQFAQETVTGLFGKTSPGKQVQDGAKPRVEVLLAPVETAPTRPAARERAATPLTIRVAVAGADGDSGGRGVADTTAAVAEAYAEACAELAARLAVATAERDEAQASMADTRRALAIAGDLDQRNVTMTVMRMLACVAESAGAARASFAFVTAEGFDGVVALPGDGNLLLDSPGGQRYLQTLAQADGARLQEAGADLELWALLGEGERQLSALMSLPIRTASRTVGMAVLYFMVDDPLPTPAALQHLELLASVFAGPLAMATHAELPKAS
jgi:signal recognition particle receptor subunit beta